GTETPPYVGLLPDPSGTALLHLRPSAVSFRILSRFRELSRLRVLNLPARAGEVRPMTVRTIYTFTDLDFDRPGKAHYEVAFHHDGTWGNVLVPLTVINGARGAGKTVACFGGTHGNEYEGQVAVWKLAQALQPEELAGRVILMPRLCTPACDAGSRE